MTTITVTGILYMEDDPALASLLQKSLERRGFIVDTAPNGEEGLKMLDASQYDVLAGGLQQLTPFRSSSTT